jgi:hypothetical protein
MARSPVAPLSTEQSTNSAGVSSPKSVSLACRVLRSKQNNDLVRFLVIFLPEKLWPSGVFSPFLHWFFVCVGYRLPRLTTGLGRLSLPLRFFAMTPGRNGLMAAAGVGAITGTGSIIGAGFFMRETVGGGFLGMAHIMAPLPLEIKPEGLVESYSVPLGQYPSPTLIQSLERLTCAIEAAVMSSRRPRWKRHSPKQSSAIGNDWQSSGSGSNARNPTGSICEVRAGGKKIHRTTLMREKWIFGSIYERPGLYEHNRGLWHPPASLVPLGMMFS